MTGDRNARLAGSVSSAVCVTPVAVERDSRTYKQAATLAANGFRTFVYEGSRSGRGHERLPFALISPHGAAQDTAEAPRRGVAGFGQTGLAWLRGAWRVLRARAQSPVVLFFMFLAYLSAYLWRHVLKPLVRLPRADVYILHEFSAYPAVRVRAALCRAPIIYDAHDFYSEIEPTHVWSAFDRKWLAPFHHRLERACIRDAAAVLTVSGRLADLLRERFGAEAMIVRNLHDTRLDLADAPSLREQLGLSDDAFLLVTVGNRKCGQALSSALDSLTQLPDRVHLAFVGSGYQDIRVEAARRNLAGRVHVPGRLALDEVVPALRGADASLILYYAHSANYGAALPNGLFQSIAAELPILYPDLPEIGKLMRAWKVGLVIDPQDARSIAEAVSRLMATPHGAGSAEARRKFARVHEWVQEEDEFVSAVRRVLLVGNSREASMRRGERST